MAHIEQIIECGILLNRAVMTLDTEKRSFSAQDLARRLTFLYAGFINNSEIEVTVDVIFDDVHKILGHATHTELCYVRLVGTCIQFMFHPRLLGSTNLNTGLVFVAKSWVLLPIIHRMIRIHSDIECSFVFEIGDNGGLQSVSFCSSNPSACLIPDYEFITMLGYKEFRRIVANQRISWERRSDLAFWRGSTTGQRSVDGQVGDFSWLPRLRLCALASTDELRPLCDIGITSIVQIPEPHLVERIKQSGFLKDPVSRKDFLRYKSIIDIDGNSNAWSGLFCSLLGSSCVLKVTSASGYRQWYYDRLEPWINYVPVQSDLADLKEAIEWVRSHDSQAKAIGRRARSLANHITLEQAIDHGASALYSWLFQRR